MADLSQYKDFLLGASTIAVDGRIIGYTEGGVAITPEVSIMRAPEIDQIDGDIPLKEYDRKYVIKILSPISSLENINLAWGLDNEIAVAGGTRTLPLGRTVKTIPSVNLKIFSKYFDDRDVTFTFDNARIIPGGDLAHSKKDHAKVAMTFEVSATDAKLQADE
jgi:hypothetical protein